MNFTCGNAFLLSATSHILAGVLAVSNPTHGIDINGNGYTYDDNDVPIDEDVKQRLLDHGTFLNLLFQSIFVVHSAESTLLGLYRY